MADNNTEKQRVQELTDKLEQGLQDLFNSDSYRNYLSTMSKFHNYSFNNTLLIAMQKPDATLVAGYKAWQKNFERHVNKGEKAIRILAPAPYKIKEERDKIDPVTQELLLDKDGNPQKEEVEITIRHSGQYLFLMWRRQTESRYRNLRQRSFFQMWKGIRI